jgi:hypothetical protein
MYSIRKYESRYQYMFLYFIFVGVCLAESCRTSFPRYCNLV